MLGASVFESLISIPPSSCSMLGLMQVPVSPELHWVSLPRRQINGQVLLVVLAQARKVRRGCNNSIMIRLLEHASSVQDCLRHEDTDWFRVDRADDAGGVRRVPGPQERRFAGQIRRRLFRGEREDHETGLC